MSDPSSVSGDFDFNNILTSHLSRVEILKEAKFSLWKWCHWRDNKYYYKKEKMVSTKNLIMQPVQIILMIYQ